MRHPSVLVERNYPAMSRRAAVWIDAAIRAQPRLVLALPTGTTPIGVYARLVELHRQTGTDWSQATTFNLDEYAGAGPDHPASYAHYMQVHLFGPLTLAPQRRHLPNGLASDAAVEAARYEMEIDATGGIDLAVLGVGANGHLGFNEPGSELLAATHLAELSEETRRRNFPPASYPAMGAQPGIDDRRLRQQFHRAYTMGVGTIMQARRILVLASGEPKRAVLREALRGPVTPCNPASLLQLHRCVTLVVDRAAWGNDE